MEEAQVMAAGDRERRSRAWSANAIALVLAFTMLVLLWVWLLGGHSGREQQAAILVESALLLMAGSLAFSLLRRNEAGRREGSTAFGATRLILDAMASSPGLDATVKVVLSHARSYTKADLAAIVLLGPSGRFAETATLVGHTLRNDTARLDWTPNSPHRKVLIEGKSVLLNSGAGPCGLDLPQYYPPLRNFLAVPIRVNGDVRGELLVANKASPFGAEDEACLATLAGFIGPVIANHQLMLQIRQGYLGAVEALVKAVEAKDPYTKGHSERVARFAVAIAREMGLASEQVEDIKIGAMLHDVGKIGVPEVIINKTDKLTEDEWEVIRDHPKVAAQILDPFNTSKDVLAMVYHHHERYDGKGYPAGLKGDDIPLAARILKVADSFEAMTSGRPYRSAKTRSEAVQELKTYSGSHYDPTVVSALLRVLAREWGPTAEDKLAQNDRHKTIIKSHTVA